MIYHGPISLTQKELYTSYLDAHATHICENTFASLYAWRHEKPVSALETHRSLIIILEAAESITIYGPPLGKLSAAQTIHVVAGQLKKPVLSLECLTEAQARTLDPNDWCVTEDRDNFDYVYCRKALAGLEGRRYHRKRNLVSQCLSAHECTYEPVIREKHAEEILDLLLRWRKQRKDIIDDDLNCESSAISDMLEHYDELDIMGGAIRVDGRIEAFSIAAKLTSETAVVHFEKANPEIKGLYQLINKWFAEHALAGFAYVNREQDKGLPGLSRAKQSYYPLRFVRKYRAVQRSRCTSCSHAHASFAEGHLHSALSL